MTNLDSSDLRDPQPPIPGERERARVAARADQLGRRRRIVQGGGALALVAVVAVSVAALAGGGGSSGPSRVETASPGRDTTTVAPATQATTPVSVPATVVTTIPAPAVVPDTQPAPVATDPTPAPTVPQAPAAAVVPNAFTLSGTVVGNPAGTTVTLTITGPAGSLVATADGAGNFSLSGLPPGDYSVVGQWTDHTGTATGASRMGTVTVNGDTSVHLSF